MAHPLARLTDRLAATRPDFPWEIRWLDGSSSRYGDGVPRAALVFNSASAIRRMLTGGVLGFGEAYMNGQLDIEGEILELLRFGFSEPFLGRMTSRGQRLTTALQPWRWWNSRRKARRDVTHHYNLGNAFFHLYLDESMNYSCAYYKTEDSTLEQAQADKMEHICRKLQLQPGMRLLDIGCGWGGLAIHAAKRYGVEVLGITLSQPQVEYAQELAEREGISDRVKFANRDWRNIGETFDRVVSVGMFEHVGRKNYPRFMAAWKQLLAPDGVSLLHTIGKDVVTVPDPWTQRYIFPGGMLPALHEILEVAGSLDLVPVDIENLRLHYALTLEEWLRRYQANVESVREMYGERFVRMWRFYLAGSAVGFRYGDLRLWQLTLTHGIPNDLPLTRAGLYKD